MIRLYNYEHLSEYMYTNRLDEISSGNMTFTRMDGLRIKGVLVWSYYDGYVHKGPWEEDELVIVSKLGLAVAQKARNAEVEALEKRVAVALEKKVERENFHRVALSEYEL